MSYGKFNFIPKRLEEDYHSIKDDISLVSVYTTGNVTVQGLLISDEFITDDICAIEEYKEYEKVFVGIDVPTIQPQLAECTQGMIRTPSAHRIPTSTAIVSNDVQKKKRKQVAEELSTPRKSLKVTIKKLKQSLTLIPPPSDDREMDEIVEATLLREDDGEDIEKIVEGEDEESYASEYADSIFLNEDDDSGTKIEPESHKKNTEVVNDNDIDDNDDDDNDDHTDHTLITVAKTNEMIKEAVPRLVDLANTVLNLYPTTSSSTATTSTADLQHQLYLTMKTNLQDQLADPKLWEILKAKFETS
ncbi:hypothetical protein Tco_0779725 [Tanacetum coccineum]